HTVSRVLHSPMIAALTVMAAASPYFSRPLLFFFHQRAPALIYALSLHDALPTLRACRSIQRLIPGLPISSSPSISTLTFSGSRPPSSRRNDSSALITPKTCPLSSEAPRA